MTNDLRPEPTIGELIDLLSRMRSIMDVQLDDNGEPFREGNADLYHEIVALEGFVRDCSMTAGEVTFYGVKGGR
jgi:hypothetical protein